MMPFEVGKQPTALKDKLKPGVVLFSTVTDIYYKIEKGVLVKYPAYAEADKKWAESSYCGPKKACMRPATAKEIKEISKRKVMYE